MKTAIRKAHERGHADHGWLDSHHTFSFASYYDPQFMGFGPLRVINEDRVAGGAGFPTHPHREMEIVSYVVDGALEHRDTLGTGSVIRPGDVQLMSAGKGIAHSEFNHSQEEGVHFLQIWIVPATQGAPASYEQRTFDGDAAETLVVSPDGRDGSLTIKQDVDLWRVRLAPGEALRHAVRGSASWVQVIRGSVTVGPREAEPGDGVALLETEEFSMRAGDEAVEALVFDLP